MRKQPDFTTVRVRKSTLRSLERVREEMLRGAEQGQREIDWDSRNRWGLDRVIRELILFRERWRRRKRDHAERRTPPTAPPGPVTDGGRSPA